MTLLFRESLERLSQQERCIAGLEARLAEATVANQEYATMAKNQEYAKHQEANIVKQELAEENNNRGMIAQMAEKLTKKKRSKEVEDEDPTTMEDGRGGRRGSSSSGEFRVEEEDLEKKVGGRRGSSSSREFQHEGEVGTTNTKTKTN